MKYLIFLALVVHALAGPAGKPDKRPGGPLGPKPSGPPPTGSGHDHHDVTGLPPHDNSSRPPHPEGLDGHPRHRRQASDALRSAPPKTGNPPQSNGSKPAGGPPPSGKPPAEAVSQAKPGQAGNPPQSNGSKPAGGPPPSGKPPAEPVSQAKPGQSPKPRPKRHLKGNENHPTGAPHGDHTHSAHTHESGASRPTHPANHGEGKPGGHKGQRG
ncbi:uncharacterized protein [Phyllobates terribilis]|uniref:uncharacterized protein n=1 Tax=Phyllobates terribilis TaxID=111132 RepID=UPI003CCB2C9B